MMPSVSSSCRRRAATRVLVMVSSATRPDVVELHAVQHGAEDLTRPSVLLS